ncbi:MAG: cellobiose phosphorylase [Lachnospiraceae bacterium]|nr:cellobiose phosphorylase [Lachnospiraceae bacterium]
MSNYKLEDRTFVIKNYDQVAPFSSFLPGIAGVKGIPLWCFYTNRGQGVNSFGIHDKDHAIMEFNPANTAYENTPVKGFRTFIKANGKVTEPFAGYSDDSERTFYIRENCFWIEDLNKETGLKTEVKYFLVPNETYGALVRTTTIENTTGKDIDLEVLDGMAKLIPYGLLNSVYKNMSNLFRSWTDVHNIENNIPVFNLATAGEDSADAATEISKEGIFYLSFVDGKILPPVYDNDAVFGPDSSMVTPVYFKNHSIDEITSYPQVFANRIPGCFTPVKATVKAGAKLVIRTLIGHTDSPEEINALSKKIVADGYIASKEAEAMDLVSGFTKDVKTHTSNPVFDKYIEQCYLDNFLRGGYPFIFPAKDGSNKVVHLFSRKHGDPERDYNFFSTAGEFYSQGNGNFRDVNQNRRNDVFFHPAVGDFNVKTFFSLVQADGFNPLEVRSYSFSIKKGNEDALNSLIDKSGKTDKDKEELKKLTSGKFTPGKVVNGIFHKGIGLNTSDDEFLQSLLEISDQNIEAKHGEGYWSDHWDYNFDLVEDYLRIFPDKKDDFLYNNTTYRFYDSAVKVMPRKEVYVLSQGRVRSFGHLVEDEKKKNDPTFDVDGTNWLKNENGEYVEVSLFTKMLFLAAIKFSEMDSAGMGIEMDGGKPGWNDAMNGLPGVLGSGMPETMELERIVAFLKNEMALDRKYEIPEEIAELIVKTSEKLKEFKAGKLDQFNYWDQVSSAREAYRDKIQYSMTGKNTLLSADEIKDYLELAHEKILAGIKKAKEFGNGLMPTYFTFTSDDYDIVKDADGNVVNTHYGLPAVKVHALTPQHVPAFLEAPARYLKTLTDHEEAVKLYNEVKESDLFDRKLKMYKTCVPLDDMGLELGRVRAFTPGWQERESVFLHMSYKYQYGLLKAGLYDEFFEEMKSVLIPFLNPETYGRSTLENSSFIASSLNPDPSTHGRGFVSRLSGSTTEVLSMWSTMMAGAHPFTVENGELTLSFKPTLVDWLFDDKGEISFQLCSDAKVTYVNPAKKSTFGKDAVSVSSIVIDGKDYGNKLTGDIARAVRDGKVSDITVKLA